MGKHHPLTAAQAVRIVHLSLLEMEDVWIALESKAHLRQVQAVQGRMRTVETNRRETGYGCPDFERCPFADDCLGPGDRPCPDLTEKERNNYEDQGK